MRDIRIDHVGFVGELQKQFADALKSRIKADLIAESAARAAGDAFEALLVTGTTQTVDPEKFLRAFERGRISRAQFLAAIRVTRDAAMDALGRDDLAKISTEAPSAPTLRITRIKGVEVSLVSAIKQVAAAIE